MKNLLTKVLLAVLIVAFSVSTLFAAYSITGQVNLNTASLTELQLVPYLGAKKAQAIIEYRTNNKFNSVSDIQKVKGISKKVFDKVKDYLKVVGSSDIQKIKVKKGKK
ncbi:MAG: ComEA family DNA-binding protein [Pseudomonadota bacterium]